MNGLDAGGGRTVTGKRSVTTFAWLSVGAALLTIGLKASAYWVTGSVGLLSDALESVVNLAAALLALAMLRLAVRPADEGHAYGHFKAEYFASAAEGAMIVLAAAARTIRVPSTAAAKYSALKWP